MSRETIIRCDACGERLPGTDDAHYTIMLTCLTGPNRDPIQPRPQDLCGFCAGQVRHLTTAASRNERVVLEVQHKTPHV